jgi:hypothetical protein
MRKYDSNRKKPLVSPSRLDFENNGVLNPGLIGKWTSTFFIELWRMAIFSIGYAKN